MTAKRPCRAPFVGARCIGDRCRHCERSEAIQTFRRALRMTRSRPAGRTHAHAVASNAAPGPAPMTARSAPCGTAGLLRFARNDGRGIGNVLVERRSWGRAASAPTPVIASEAKQSRLPPGPADDAFAPGRKDAYTCCRFERCARAGAHDCAVRSLRERLDCFASLAMTAKRPCRMPLETARWVCDRYRNNPEPADARALRLYHGQPAQRHALYRCHRRSRAAQRSSNIATARARRSPGTTAAAFWSGTNGMTGSSTPSPARSRSRPATAAPSSP